MAKSLLPNRVAELVVFHDTWEEEELQETLEVYELVNNASSIESVTIDEEFTDDHCPCFDCTVKMNNGEVKVGFYWLSPTGVKLIYRSEVHEESRKELLEWMKLETNGDEQGTDNE